MCRFLAHYVLGLCGICPHFLRNLSAAAAAFGGGDFFPPLWCGIVPQVSAQVLRIICATVTQIRQTNSSFLGAPLRGFLALGADPPIPLSRTPASAAPRFRPGNPRTKRVNAGRTRQTRTDFTGVFCRAFPSHGRGRRFNPYSAHHFTGAFRPRPGTTRQNTARTGKFSRAKSVHIVHGAFVFDGNN